MSNYVLDATYQHLTYATDDLNFTDFERCTFSHCNFSACTFLAVTFIDCTFTDCVFDGAKINYVALRTAAFIRCQIREVNFSMCDKLIFEISFNQCILDFSKFYTLKLKATPFLDCSLVAVDFMAADLTEAIFDNCDLYRAEFAKAIAHKADFRTSWNYTIDPEKTKIKKAMFSRAQVKGLLYRHEIQVAD